MSANDASAEEHGAIRYWEDRLSESTESKRIKENFKMGNIQTQTRRQANQLELMVVFAVNKEFKIISTEL
jgi:hypothetical protein